MNSRRFSSRLFKKIKLRKGHRSLKSWKEKMRIKSRNINGRIHNWRNQNARPKSENLKIRRWRKWKKIKYSSSKADLSNLWDIRRGLLRSLREVMWMRKNQSESINFQDSPLEDQKLQLNKSIGLDRSEISKSNRNQEISSWRSHLQKYSQLRKNL